MIDDVIGEIARLYADGVKVSEIAAKVGYSKKYVEEVIQDDRMLFPYRKRRVPKEVVEKAVSDVIDGGKPAKAVAYEIGCHVNTVRAWVRKDVEARLAEAARGR